MAARRRCARLAAAASLIVLLTAAPAGAAGVRPLEKAMWGPVEVDGASQFPLYRDLGVTLFQIQLRWDRVATARPADATDPADPVYRWPAEVDRAVEEGQRYGIKVLVLVQGTPGWANQGRPWPTPPDDLGEYARFVTAAARRYDTVRHWMIWGEPLRNVNWPGYDRSRPGRLRIARTYARLLDGAYAALKRESRRNVVVGGNTFTTDSEPVYWAPVPLFEWMRILRLPNGRPPRMDVWGHNPFTTRIPRLKDPPGPALGDFSDLDRVLARLRRHVARPLRRRIPLFVSEWCLPTGPNPLFPLELTQRQQADWLGRGLRIARGQPGIWGLGWWTLRDDPAATGSNRANRCGLIDANGRPKLAYRTFKRGGTRRG